MIMKYSRFVKSGKKVFHTWFKEVVTIDEILDLCNENQPTKKEIDQTPKLVNVYVVDSEGQTFLCDPTDLQPWRHVDDLCYNELKKLRGQICLGSCYVSDYKNTLGVEAKEVSQYADGFGEAIGWDESKDTAENFALYCLGELDMEESA